MRPTVVGIRTVCPAEGCTARAPRRAPTTAHTDLTGAPTGPTACPREKGTIPHASNRTFDRWPLRAPLPARSGRNGNRVACLGPLPAPRRGHQRSPPALRDDTPRANRSTPTHPARSTSHSTHQPHPRRDHPRRTGSRPQPVDRHGTAQRPITPDPPGTTRPHEPHPGRTHRTLPAGRAEIRTR